MKKLAKINIDGKHISLKKVGGQDYLCLSDMASNMGKEDGIKNWMRNKDTLELLGTRELLHNPDFNQEMYKSLRQESGTGRFLMSPQKWRDNTNAIGIVSKPGKGGGTYAHIDIALEFATHLSPALRIYINKDYQRLKNEEQLKINTNRNQKRALSKVNYGFMTDAIKDHLIPEEIQKNKIRLIYAEEADIVNKALFGMTASEWKSKHKKEAEEGNNMRDFASPEQLVVLANLEYKNSDLIKEGVLPEDRLIQLNGIAIEQMTKLAGGNNIKKLGIGDTPKYLN